MTDKTLHVRVESSADFIESAGDAIGNYAEDGEIPPDDQRFVLSFESLDGLLSVLRATNLELLNAIAEHEPQSMRETARLVDRSIPNVKENLDELEAHDLIEYETHGSAKRPVIWYDRLAVEAEVGLPDDSLVRGSAPAA